MKTAGMLRETWKNPLFSYVYTTAAQDALDQDSFLNAVARIETDHSHDDIYSTLRSIESALEKNPPYPKGPRTIDLDFLLYDNKFIEEEDLVVPHPRMHQRRFVLEPLCDLIEIAARHPVLEEAFFDLLEKTREQECELVDLTL